MCLCGVGVLMDDIPPAYEAFFVVSINSPITDEIWRSRARAPYNCKFFVWLASPNHYWTADRLQHRGLPCPAACPLYGQELDTLQHLLLGYVVAHQVWH
jgi:hypothetical protein